MTGIHNYFIRQGPEFSSYAVDECIKITHRQISPSNTSIEKHITTNDELLFAVVETNASG